MSRHPFPRRFIASGRLAAGLIAALVLGPLTGAAALPHLDQLSASESLATGLVDLTDQERANLDNLIAYEVASARAGGVTGFAGTFSSRRSDGELDATGLNRLGDDQRERLDQHIAGMIADHAAGPFVYSPALSGHGAADGTDTSDAAEIKAPGLILRHEVSVTVGGGDGGSYYGGSVTTTMIDPKGRWAASVSVGASKGATPYYGRGPGRYSPWW